jgi:transposase
MKDLFGIFLYEGTIDNGLAKKIALAMPFYNQINRRIQESKLVGGDETGTKINGRKALFHVWQNPLLTFIVAAATRGYKTLQLISSIMYSVLKRPNRIKKQYLFINPT